MGLRTTSTLIPPTSMVVSRLILTLVLYDLENLVRADLVLPQLLAHGVADFPLLESVTAPVVLSGVAYGGVHANGCGLVVVQIVVQGALGGGVYRARILTDP